MTIERDPKTRRMHVTAGYLRRALRAYPDLIEHITPRKKMAEALAELDALPPEKLISCGVSGCPDCGGE